MWPLVLDLTKDECKRMLRRLELEAYSSVITAFRAQGDLSKDKKKVLQDLGTILGISTERHRAEIRRAVNDEHLTTVADQVGGCSVSSEWAMEGRRLVPLMPRLVPQTAFSALANNAANVLAVQNACMPSPSSTTTSKREATFSSPASSAEVNATKTSDVNSKSLPNPPMQDVPASTVILGERDNPNFSSPTPTQEDIYTQHIRFTPFKSNNSQEAQTQFSGQTEVAEPLATPTISSNIGGAAVLMPAAAIKDIGKGRQYRRSPSTDNLASAPNQSQNPQIPETPQVSKVTTLPGATSTPRTVSIPIGGAPVQFTLTGNNPKAPISASSGSGSSQKVILVSTSCSSLPSSILQRSLGVPVVKTVTTTGSTVNIAGPQLKPASLLMPGSSSSTTPSSASSSSPSLSLSPHDPAISPMLPGVPPLPGLQATAPVKSTSVDELCSPPATRSVIPPSVCAVQMPPSQAGGVAAQHSKMPPKRILVPLTSQGSPSGQALKIKQPGGLVKPSSIHIRQEGLKIIAETLPLSGGSKLIPKSGSGTAPPIVVVTKTSSLTQSSQSAARIVNVLTTQAASTGKLLTPTGLTVSKAGGTPTLMTVGAKGKQAALVKMSPSMSLSTAGGKPNVIVVQKAHMVCHSASGNTITVSSSSLSAAAQTVLKSTLGTTFAYGDKVQKKSTVLADLLQAAGILPEGSATSETVSIDSAKSRSAIEGTGLAGPSSKSTYDIAGMAAAVQRSEVSFVSATKNEPTKSETKQKPTVVGLVVNSKTGKCSGPITANQPVAPPALVGSQDAQSLETMKKATTALPTKLDAGPLSSLQDPSSQIILTSKVGATSVTGKVQLASAARKEGSNVAPAVLAGIAGLNVPILPSSTLSLKSDAKLVTVGCANPDEFGELDPQTGLFHQTSKDGASGQSGNYPLLSAVQKKTSVVLRQTDSAISTVAARVSALENPLAVASCDAGASPKQTASTSTKPVVSSHILGTAPGTRKVGGTQQGADPRPDSSLFSVEPPNPKIHLDTKSEDSPIDSRPTVGKSEKTDLVVCANQPACVEERETTVLVCESSSGSQQKDLTMALESLQKPLYRGATYSREDVASRKKHCSSEISASPLESLSEGLPSQSEDAIAESETPLGGIEESASVALDDVVTELLTTADTLLMATTESSLTDSSIGNDGSMLNVKNAKNETTPATTWLLTDDMVNVPLKDDVESEISTAEPSQSEADDQLIFIAPAGDLEVPSEESLPHEPMTEQPKGQLLTVADGKDEVSVIPNVTVEMLPIVPLEFSSSLLAAAHPGVIDEILAAHHEGPLVAATEEVLQNLDSALDEQKEVTFLDDGLTVGGEETVVTVELEYEIDSSADQFVAAEAVVDVDVGIIGGCKVDDQLRSDGATNEGTDIACKSDVVVEGEEESSWKSISEDVIENLGPITLCLPCDIMQDPQTSVELQPDDSRNDSITIDHALPVQLASSDVLDVAVPLSHVVLQKVKLGTDLHGPGSSMFMVTDSVQFKEDEVSHPESEVTVAEDVLALLDISTTPIEGEMQPSTSGEDSEITDGTLVADTTSAGQIASGDLLTPNKRKRKPIVASPPEENLNIPHLSGWARSAMGLLLRVMKFRGFRKMKGELSASHWFLRPVTDEEAPGYHQIVREPMDFSTIKTKLEMLCYRNISEFHADMMIVKTNCELYNPAEHEARKDCEEVFNFYVQEYDRLIEKWQKTHLFSPAQKKFKLGT